MQNVVCALDLGPRSPAVLTWANRLATDFQAHLHLLHVLPGLDPSEAMVFPADVPDKRSTAVREELRKLQTAFVTTGSTVEVVEGEVPQAIRSYGRAVEAGLLVIGRGAPQQSHGRLRGHAYGIVRLSACPVLSV
jgi:K+-sensing histidine kinase KdpD